MTETGETDFIVLRQTPYNDRMTVVSGIAPEFGRMSFAVNGGSKRPFPEVELFRLLHLEFQWASQGDLHRLKTADLTESFDSVSADYGRYTAASWLASFSLLNVMPMLPHTLFFTAMEVALRRLSTRELCPEASLTGAALAFVFEEGWLAHALTTPQASSQCRTILEMAVGKDAPNLSRDSWREQFEWVKQLLLYNECRLPAECSQ